jgi:hypothetical protein
MKRMILKNTLMTFLVKRNKTLGKKEIQIWSLDLKKSF